MPWQILLRGFLPCNAYFFIDTIGPDSSAGPFLDRPGKGLLGSTTTLDKPRHRSDRHESCVFASYRRLSATVLLGALAGLILACPLAAAAEDTAKERKGGGFEVKLPQSPALAPVPIGYILSVSITRDPPRASMLSRKMPVSPAPRWRVEENNAGGRFTGHVYTLDVETVASPEKALEAMRGAVRVRTQLLHRRRLRAARCSKLADWAKGKDVLLFNVRATDVSLRQEDCRTNVMHIVPDRYMLADALAQYLVSKWTGRTGCSVRGSTPAIIAYAEAIKRAAGRFGAHDRRRARVQGQFGRQARRRGQ